MTIGNLGEFPSTLAQLMVEFCLEQSRCNFSLLLFLIEAKLLLMSVYTVSDGVNYIVADGENSLRQGQV
jgi:hypothetical protein